MKEKVLIMEKKYILILNGTDNEVCSLARALEYTQNRLEANPMDALLWMSAERLERLELVFNQLNLKKEDNISTIGAIEEEYFIQDHAIDSRVRVDKLILSALKEEPIRSLESAKLVLQSFDEDINEVDFDLNTLKLTYLACYPYSYIDTLVNNLKKVNADVEVRDVGVEHIGEFMTLLFVDGELAISFILSGSSGAGYIMRVIFISPDFSIDGEGHS